MVHSKMDIEGVIGKWLLSVLFHTVLAFNDQVLYNFYLVSLHKILRQVFDLQLQMELVLEDPIFYH